MAFADLGAWRDAITDADALGARLDAIFSTHRNEVDQVQRELCRPLFVEDPDKLSKQLAWHDSQLYRMGYLKADADALLDFAENFYLISNTPRDCPL